MCKHRWSPNRSDAASHCLGQPQLTRESLQDLQPSSQVLQTSRTSPQHRCLKLKSNCVVLWVSHFGSWSCSLFELWLSDLSIVLSLFFCLFSLLVTSVCDRPFPWTIIMFPMHHLYLEQRILHRLDVDEDWTCTNWIGCRKHVWGQKTGVVGLITALWRPTLVPSAESPCKKETTT